MHCQQANELFSDYIERSLNSAMTVSMDNHLAACSECREEVAALRRVWTQLDQAPVVEPPARLHNALMDALDAHLESEQRVSTPRAAWTLRDLFRPRTLAYAAAALVLALSSLELVQSQRAALGPLGMMAHLLHPRSNGADSITLPAITATHSEWQSRPDGGGTLIIALKTETGKADALAALTYQAEVLSGDTTSHKTSASSAQNRFDATGSATLRLSLPTGIDGPQVRLMLSFMSPDGAKVAQQEIIVPVEKSEVDK